MRRKCFTLFALALMVFVVGWATVRGQVAPEPGSPDYFDAKIALLLDYQTPDRAPDQMYRLLSFLFADSMVRAGELILDDTLEIDQQLQAQLIAETGVWEAVYRVAVVMPPLQDPKFAPMQGDITEAMRLSVVAAADIRDYAMTGNLDSLNAAIPAIEEMNALLMPYAALVGP